MNRLLIPNIVRWVARILEVLLACYYWLLIGAGDNIVLLTGVEKAMIASLLTIFLGFILAWWWERIGAIVMLVGATLWGGFGLIENGSFAAYPYMAPVVIVVALHFTSSYLRTLHPILCYKYRPFKKSLSGGE
jgi:hypothetical protein